MPPNTTSIIHQRLARRAKARRGHERTLRALAGLGLTLALGILLMGVGVVGVLFSFYNYYTHDLPSASALRAAFDPSNDEFFQTTQIFDRTGQHLLYEVIDPRGGDRQYVTYAQIPPAVVSATIALEDKSFFTNPGYDLVGISRALISNLRGESIQGGSSITQQLVKNTLIPIEQRAVRSYDRKAREILLAAEITRQYSKEQILEWYLNTNFFGNLAYGIDAAALVYFDKHASGLTLAEAALLAAIPNSPGLNPATDLAGAKQRQELVLDVMAREGFISVVDAEVAKQETITLKPPVRRFNLQAPHFSIYVRQQLVKMFGEDLVNRGGLKVITTLDLDLQRQAECAARTQVARLSGGAPDLVVPAEGGAACAAAAFLPPPKDGDAGIDHHVTNAALVALRPSTGEILALVGSLDYWNTAISGNFNIAVDGLRQPGSAFKPFTYLEAFRLGYGPASMMLDIPTNFPQANGSIYAPENYDRKFHGPVSMRVALARSYNIPAVQTLNLVGVDNVIRRAHQLGINSLETGHYGLALTLGGGEVTLMDLTYAYSVFANSGVMAGQPVPPEAQRPGYRMLNPMAILRVEDRAGQVLYQLDTPKTQSILSPELAYLINNVLSDGEARVAAFGAGNPLELDNRTAAAKTGTTNDFRDNWTAGYVPQLAVGVWVGNADNSSMQAVTGLTGAAPLWHAVMTYAVQAQNLPPQEWAVPPGIVTVKVCEPSGKRPTRQCPRTRDEIFLRGTEPASPDNIWQTVAINRDTGKRATVCTPPELVEERVFEILPPEASDWVRESNLPQPPTEYDALNTACVASGNAALLSPQPFAYVHGVVEIRGTARSDADFAFFRLQYGQGLFPTAWTQIQGDRSEQVDNDVLQTWDTTGLDGLYSLQLTVVKNDPNGGPYTFDIATIQVTVDNQPPTLQLVAPAPGETLAFGEDEQVVMQAEAHDNLSLSRVVFFVNDTQVDVTSMPPYSTRWKLPGPGTYTLSAQAYDAAGNMAESQHVAITVK
jgi:membrane carboxypeptidase/penicillin-binding protein